MSLPSRPDDDRRDLHLRVGTAQREGALEVLRNAAADERITFAELEARVPQVLHAVTRRDLAAVLDDLLPATEIDGVVGGDPPVGTGAGYSWDNPLVLEREGWRELYIAHAWEVPPFLEVHASIGGVRLDFTDAIPRAKIIDLVIIVGNWGTTQLIVPEGWGVDVASWQTDVSTLQLNGIRTRPRPGLPRIIVRGQTNGSVYVRKPTDRDRKRAARDLERNGGTPPALPRA
ncbi:MAG: DUF1707 domain-containing protein [Micropruina sp.]|uniref:DUF1707 SHOCT-like domain-containing protein n=1 Tax=Micropruina sp. TaxID=2737536 RepID=UPI0039E58AC7